MGQLDKHVRFRRQEGDGEHTLSRDDTDGKLEGKLDAPHETIKRSYLEGQWSFLFTRQADLVGQLHRNAVPAQRDRNSVVDTKCQNTAAHEPQHQVQGRIYCNREGCRQDGTAK